MIKYIFIFSFLFFLPLSLQGQDFKNRMALAGEAFEDTIFGKTIKIAARERSKTIAINSVFFASYPKVSSPSIFPLAGIFYKRFWKDQRLRVFLIGIANQGLYGQTLSSKGNDSSEFLLLFDNITLPFAREELLGRNLISETKIFEGFLRLAFGLGWKRSIAPYNTDNFASVHLLYEPSFLYFKRTSDTSTNYLLPPDTYEHRVHLRGRLKGIQRNILEMKLVGFSGGFDFVFGKRVHWRNHGYLGKETKKNTGEYYILTAYAIKVFGIPWLSKKHRLFTSLYGGYSPSQLDRYSSMTLGSSSSADEAESLSSPILWGATFREYLTREYLISTLEYRYQILFFMYAHFRVSLGMMNFRDLDLKKRETYYHRTSFGAFSFGFTSGFLWNSVFVFDYGYNLKLQKGNQRGGHVFVLRWSKAF